MQTWIDLLAGAVALHAAAASYAGLVIGGLLTVVWWRLRTLRPDGWRAAMRTLSSPGSRCPHCDGAIAWRDKIPVLGWALAGARCRSCRTPIPLRYPLTEAAAAALLAALTAPWWGTAAFWGALALTGLLLPLVTARAAGFRPAGPAIALLLPAGLLLALA